jgi:hypothetical protein
MAAAAAATADVAAPRGERRALLLPWGVVEILTDLFLPPLVLLLVCAPLSLFKAHKRQEERERG